MRILLLCILISLAICHQQSDHRVSFEPRLQFHNKNGSGLKPEQLSFFVQVANYASKVYGDDIEKNLKYIKAKMDSAYGMGSAAFQVFIQTDQEVVNWSIMVLVQSIYAAVEGINELYPKWSYFFGLYIGSQNIAQYVYFHGGMGSGFTQNLIDTATTAVLEQEEPQCGCGTDGLKSIENALYSKTMNSWSIICSNLNNTYSLIRSYQDQWITIRPRNCYYTIFS